jgi:hypothetical protein
LITRAGKLDDMALYYHEHRGQEQFKTGDGRWFKVAFAVDLIELDFPTCDFCAAELKPEEIGREGPGSVIGRACCASPVERGHAA